MTNAVESKLTEYRARIKRHNVQLNSFLDDTVIAAPGATGPLSNLVVAIKDNIMVKNLPITAGSQILKGHISSYDATVIARLKAAGATLLGKTNLDEFAMGSSTENSAYGATHNPWDSRVVPGGSSGGSASAVAAGLCDVALGSDTGGSIRQPAAFCGVLGLKPTYGAVSRYGLIALASSLDQIGPIAKTADDAEKVFAAIAGSDPLDQTTAKYSYQPIKTDLKKLRIGLPKELWELDIDPQVKKSVRAMIDFFVSQGATISDCSLPSITQALPAYYVILPAEASSNLARYDGIRYPASQEADTLLERYVKTRSQGFGAEVKRRILLGTFVLSHGHYDAYYQSAVAVKEKITAEYTDIFKKVDVLLSPTTPTLPFALGSRVKDPIAMYQADLLTVSANLAGVPALSLPCGFSAEGLPIGAQLIGGHWQENVLLDLAKQYQAETNYHQKFPEKYQ